MAKSIQDILGSKNVQGVFEAIKPGFPLLLPPSFYQVTRRVNGKHFTYNKVEGTRKTAKVNHYNAKSTDDNPSGVDAVPVDCIFSNFHWDVDPVDLINIANPGTEDVQELSTGEVMRRLAEEKQKQINLRNTAVHMALVDGTIYADADGNLLPNSSNAVKLSIDFSVPATNKNQLQDIDGNTIIGATWDTAGTSIASHVRLIKETAVKRTGYPITTAIYGSNVVSYILKNTELSNLMQSNAALTVTGQSGVLPENLLGLRWLPGDMMFWEDSGGTTRSLVGADEVIFLPDPSPQWFELVEGSYPMADSVDLGSGEMAIGGLRMARGQTVQSKLTDDPVSAQMIHRDCFLPTLKVPSAIYIADVTP